jgi:hypothetical protein
MKVASPPSAAKLLRLLLLLLRLLLLVWLRLLALAALAVVDCAFACIVAVSVSVLASYFLLYCRCRSLFGDSLHSDLPGSLTAIVLQAVLQITVATNISTVTGRKPGVTACRP